MTATSETTDRTDTICAIATGRGGAIGIIRVSGSDAINITDKIFTPATDKDKPLRERKAYTLTFGFIKDGRGETIDDVLVSVFRAPHSYTGEDSTEISCHGSQYILQQIMQLLIDNGCRAAGPGEFTKRAFLNGKMDLSQAEAVADLIASNTKAAHKLAINQMRGGFSKKLARLRDELLRLTSLLELELDFSDHEELEFADRTELDDISQQAENAIKKLTDSFRLGNAVKNGIPVAIIGETNAGKSTLLNTLVGEERSIVSDIHGTTRDVIEDTVNIDGITFRFIDTAGIRETSDTIEKLGIERTFKKIAQADIVLWMIDMTDNNRQQLEKLSEQIFPKCENKCLILVYNKVDIRHGQQSLSILPNTSQTIHEIFISAKNGTNIDRLKSMLVSAVGVSSVDEESIIVTNVRHYEALTRSLSAIQRVRQGLSDGIPADLISQDLRECIYHLAEIVGGEITSEEILLNIFKHFCIGK